MSVSFSLEDSDYTQTNGGADFEDVLGGVVSMRILSSSSPSAFGDIVAATIGVDNIVAVPEPGSVTLIGFAGLLLLRRKRC